jgi:hypothetical protein
MKALYNRQIFVALEESMESTQPDAGIPAKKNQTPLIAAGIAALLCCCCAILAVAGYYGYNTMQAQEVDLQPFEDATPEIGSTDDEIPTPEFEVPSTDFGIGEAPIGGLGNDILRNDTWQYVAFAAMGQGCDQPVSDESTIEVLQEPQNGVWVEQWTVACASGDSYAYEVEFVLDDTGTTFNITSLP